MAAARGAHWRGRGHDRVAGLFALRVRGFPSNADRTGSETPHSSSRLTRALALTIE